MPTRPLDHAWRLIHSSRSHASSTSVVHGTNVPPDWPRPRQSTRRPANPRRTQAREPPSRVLVAR